MRKRSEAGSQQGTLGGAPEAEQRSTTVDAANFRRLPIEDDASAMAIELKKRGYPIGVSVVRDWEPGPRHLVAMWIDGSLAEDDIPEAIKRFKASLAVPAIVEEAAAKEAKEEVDTALLGGDVKGAVKAAEKLRSIEGGKKEPPKASVISIDATGLEAAEMTESMTITWGSEKYQPFTGGNFSNYEVGMISRTIHVRPGEDAVKRARKVRAELRAIFEEAREEKKESFLRHMKSHKPDPK